MKWLKKLWNKIKPAKLVNPLPSVNGSKGSMQRMPPRSSTVVKGVDVSHYQSTQDWKKLKAEGNHFMFAKASEGLTYVDPKYLMHITAARAAGLYVGAYHFFHPSMNAIEQAIHFVQCAGKADMYVIDWEKADGMTPITNAANGLDFLKKVEELTGKVPFVYAGAYTLRDVKLPTVFTKYPLWIAAYETTAPLLPPPWSNWTFWQYSEKSGLDKNYFNGSLDELRSLIAPVPNVKG